MATLDELRKAGFQVTEIKVGCRVICDSCNREYTNNDAVGGVLFNRAAYCPLCAPRIIYSAKRYKKERYLTYPEEGEMFRDFVLRIR